MSILTVFNLSSMNTEKYNQVVKDLEAAGHGNPKGRLYHVASVLARLDLLGPLEVASDTRDELLVMASTDGELRWDTEQAVEASAQRVGDMLALVTSTKEYQFA